MKTLTYNKHHDWIKNSQSWRMFENLDPNKKQKTYQYGNYKFPYVNIIWHQIGIEFREKFGEEIKVYKHYCIDTWKQLGEDEKFDHINPVVYIHTSINTTDSKITLNFSIRGIRTLDWFSIVPPKNMIINSDNIVKEIRKYIDKNILYPPGLFRNIQLYNGYTKQMAKDLYKQWLKQAKFDIEDNDLQEQKVVKWVKKHFNIDGSNVTLNTLIKFVNNNGKQPKLIKIALFDWASVIHECDMCDGDIDELEETYWNAIEEAEDKSFTYIY